MKIRYALLTKQTAGCVAQITEKVYAQGYERLALPTAREAWQAHVRKKELAALAFAGQQAIAMVTLKRSEDSDKVYELGMLSVIKEYRKSAVANELLRFAQKEFARLVAFDAVFMENVSTHYYSQRKAAHSGAVACAAAFSAMPELADNAKRLSYLIYFLENKDAVPEPVYVPQRYANSLLVYYQGLKPRRFMPACYGEPERCASEIALRVLPTLKLLRISVHETGRDLAGVIAANTKDYSDYSVYVYLPLSPHVSFAVDRLAGQGFFIAGVLPFWFGVDGLLLQKCSGELAPLKIYSDKARLLAELACEDKERVYKAKRL